MAIAEHKHRLLCRAAEILASAGLLSEGIQIKQFIHFVVKDGGLERLDSVCAQAFYERLGPGRPNI